AECGVSRGRGFSRPDRAPDRRGTARPVHGRGLALRERLPSRTHVPPAGRRRGPSLGALLRGRSRGPPGVGPRPRDLPEDDRRHGGRPLGEALPQSARFRRPPHVPPYVRDGARSPSPRPEDPDVSGRGPREPGPLRGLSAPDRRAGAVRFGYYTGTVLLHDRDRARLDATAREVLKHLQHHGFGARIEEANCLEAWLGSLPGHGYQNVRRPLLHTLNLADLLPL